MKASLICIVLVLTCACRARAADPAAVLPQPTSGRDVLVGVNYFAGWWEELPNKWHGHGWTLDEPDWRPMYPDRVPLLGSFNDQATMDREIAAAADYGIDFFAILWYFAPPGSKREANAGRTNRGLECFLKSPVAHRLRFIVEYCNHDEFAARDEQQWSACARVWLEAMRHPSYLRVGGRLVFKVHDAAGLMRQNEGDVARCRARLDGLRDAARRAGLGELLIGGGIMSRSKVSPASPAAKLFDFTATYMSGPQVEPRDEEYPYHLLADEARQARAAHSGDPIPWVPYVAAGWNPRPWTHPKAAEAHRRFFAFPTRQQWTDELRALRDDLAKYPQLGLPLPNGQRQKALTIYAWNEFGEGGFIAPTQGDGAMKLEAIAEVFGRSAAGPAATEGR